MAGAGQTVTGLTPGIAADDFQFPLLGSRSGMGGPWTS